MGRYEHPYPSPELEAAHPFVRLDFDRLAPAEMRRRAESFHALMERRRSVRMFSDEPVPKELIAHAITTASTAPSGAHKQPWHFVATDSPTLKRRIRQAFVGRKLTALTPAPLSLATMFSLL